MHTQGRWVVHDDAPDPLRVVMEPDKSPRMTVIATIPYADDEAD